MVISDKSSKFIVFKYNIYQTFTAMFTESKITEIYCLADDFCKEFTKQQEKYMLEDKVEGHKHRNKPNRMSDSELMVILILFIRVVSAASNTIIWNMYASIYPTCSRFTSLITVLLN